MRLTPNLIAALALLAGALLSGLTAFVAAGVVESRATSQINAALTREGITWAQVQADGLRINLSGTAPNEAMRYRAIVATGRIVDSARVIDGIEVAPSAPIRPPSYSLELLRNDTGVSMIGLIPDGPDRETIAISAVQAAGQGDVTDMLDTGPYDVPEGWATALDFGLIAMELLPRSKISVEPELVIVDAIADSDQERLRLLRRLESAAPEGLGTVINISAPKPVIAPFTLRFVIDDSGARFDACAAHDGAGRDRIVAAARNAGLIGAPRCLIGLGVPSPDWPEAVIVGIDALHSLGGGTLSFSDADVTLVARPGTAQSRFDTITGELETALPELYSLHSVLPELPDQSAAAEGPPEFLATLSPEGQVQLRGRVRDELMRDAVHSFAVARFGRDRVYPAMVLDDTLPEGWPIRVLTGLEALAQLKNGVVVINPDYIDLQGTSGDPAARDTIARLLGEKLGESQNIGIAIEVIEQPVESTDAPDPATCVGDVNQVLASDKIIFAPGSVDLEIDALRVVRQIAAILRDCPDVPMEIGGHTDSQGREEMNQRLSQQRADAVLMALVARRVLTENLTATGYGESQPIADNETEEGREANRRIEFRLVNPDGSVVLPGVNPLDAAPASAADQPDEAQDSATDTATDGEGEQTTPVEAETETEQDGTDPAADTPPDTTADTATAADAEQQADAPEATDTADE